MFENLVKSKQYKKDKRKRVKLMAVTAENGVQWWHLFIGAKLVLRTKSRKEADSWYNSW